MYLDIVTTKKWVLSIPFLFVSLLSAQPIFSELGGIYNKSVTLVISNATNDKIYFSTDGSSPSEKSKLYTSAITMDSTTVVRAIVISASGLKSSILTHSYFIKENISLPIISLATDPEHFFSDQTGIYVKGTHGIRGLVSQS